jgi:hypothetical protein
MAVGDLLNAVLLRYVDGTDRDPVTNRPVRTVAEIPILISALQPRTSTEQTAAGGAQQQSWALFVWTDTPITGSDRVRFGGDIYELAGDAGVHRDGAQFHHQEAVVTRAR